MGKNAKKVQIAQKGLKAKKAKFPKWTFLIKWPNCQFFQKSENDEMARKTKMAEKAN